MENMKRAGLTAIETAQSIKKLADVGLTQQKIAERIGKSRVWVTQALSIATRASQEILEYAERNRIKDLYLLYSLIRLWEKNEQAARELLKFETLTNSMIRRAEAAQAASRDFTSLADVPIETIVNDEPTDTDGRNFSAPSSTLDAEDTLGGGLTNDGGSSVEQEQKSLTKMNSPVVHAAPAKAAPAPRYVYVVRLKKRQVKDEKEYMLDMNSKNLSEGGMVAIKPLHGGTDRRVVSVDEIDLIGARFVKSPITQAAGFENEED